VKIKIQDNPNVIIPVKDRARKKPSLVVATVYEIFPGGISGIAIIAYVTEEINPKIPVIITDVITAKERFFQSTFMHV
jgi:hypothetical protein